MRYVEIVDGMVYQGAHINKDGNASIEIKRRIVLAKIAMNKLNKILRKKHINPTTKRRLVDIGRAKKTLRIDYQPQ